MENIHVIPEILELPRFNKALAKALSTFPTFAGRLRQNVAAGTWWVSCTLPFTKKRMKSDTLSLSFEIQLTNSPVPLVIEPTSPQPAPRADWVVIEHLQPFVAPIELLSLVNQDKPLLSIKLSFIPDSGETVVGLMVSHIVGT